MPDLNYHLIINYLQLLGTFLFLVLYAVAACKYPGGSQEDITFVGFDWINNYWCNLLNKQAMNGDYNPSRPFAILGMSTVCISLSLFFYQFSEFIASTIGTKKAIKYGGILSMVTAAFLFTQHHDFIIISSSILGLIAAVGMLVEINKTRNIKMKTLSFFIVILVLINNGIYYSELGIKWLPVIQKLTFCVFFIWITAYNFQIRKIILAFDHARKIKIS